MNVLNDIERGRPIRSPTPNPKENHMFTHLSLSVLLSGLAVAPAPAATTSFTNNQLSIVSENDIVDTAIAAGDFDTLVAAVQAAGLVDVLKSDGPFTVFAPTDAAFAALPEGTISSLLQPENQNSLIEILTYHVVADSLLATDVVGTKGIITVNGQQINVSASEAGVFTDRAQVTVTDIICSNGVIHVIDAVMLPASGDIVRTAARTNRFNTLLAAAQAAGLADTLTNGGPYTILAPTDRAFNALPEGTVESLLLPENNDLLVQILSLHVIQGRAYASQVVQLSEIPTLEGSNLQVTLSGNRVFVNNARIIGRDIDAYNGVIHAIDTVLLPSAGN